MLNGQKLAELIPYHIEMLLAEPKTLPDVDVAAALASDAAKGIEAPRFGVKIPTNFTAADGEFEEFAGFTRWRIAFRSEGAVSLNFEFNQLTLPEGSQLFIYNQTETMVIGPVEPLHVLNDFYASDVIRGDEATVEVLIPTEKVPSFLITISGVTHGFLSVDQMSKERDWLIFLIG